MSKKILIAGAGIGGLTAALALAQQGFQVQVLEQASALGEVGAGLQISPNAMRVLQVLGLESALAAQAFRPQNASIRHYQTGRYYLKLPLGNTLSERYGAPYMHIHRADLHAVLVDAARAVGVELVLNAKVAIYDDSGQGVWVTLINNERYFADVLIGADGVRSAVLQHMQAEHKKANQGDDSQTPEFTGQVAWRGVIEADKLPKGLIKPDATVWVGPGRHMVTYYLRGGRLVNFVAVEERTDWTKDSWHERGDVHQLRSAFADWHPEVSQLLGAVEETFLWALYGRKPLPLWHAGRVVLLGDACHPMLPFMAQGAAMAIEDAYVLAQRLASCDVSEAAELEQALVGYTQKRKPRATMVQQMSRANASLYHMHGGPLGVLRLNMINAATRLFPQLVASKLDPIYGYDVGIT